MRVNPHDKDAAEEAAYDAEASLVRAYAKKVYALIDGSLKSLGGIDGAAGIVGMDRADLRRAIDRGSPTQPRYLPVEHVMAFLARMRKHDAARATEIAATVVYPASLLVFPLVEISAEEKARRYEKMLRSMPLGDRLVEEALKTP